MVGVDTSLQPNSTGEAAKLVAKHQDELPLVLWAGWFCPYVQRAWLVLEEKNIPYTYREINPYKKAPEFLELNPRGLVPTLAVPMDKNGKEQKPLYESMVICEYLDEEYSDELKHGERLLPQEDSYQRARCRLWIDHITTKIVPGFYKWMQHQPEKDYSLDEVRDEFFGNIATFVKQMAPSSQGPWFLGERFSLVDIMLAPWAKRLFLIEHWKPGGLKYDEFRKRSGEEAVWARWDVWIAAVLQRKSVRHTWSEDGEYVQAYRRYAEDTTGSQVAQATRKGARLP